MTKWIRWSGLISFTVFVGILVVFWMFAAAPIIKYSIEKFGSDAVGAKVNVKEVILGFNPLILEVNGVQVADKDAPMSNALSFDRAVADMSLFPLLLGKTIIQDMSLTGVEFGTARTVSGALPKSDNESVAEKDSSVQEAETQDTASESTKADDESKSSSQKLPSADDILAREPLLTVTRGEKFKTSLDTHKKEINDSLKNVPNKSTIAEYQKNLDQILKGKFKSLDDFKQRQKALKALKKQFKADRKAIKRATAAIKAGKKDLGSQWSGLKDAPNQDYKNIKGKYTLDAAGTSNLAALLLGEDAGGYATTALDYYEKVKPLLSSEDDEKSLVNDAKEKRLQGSFIHFPTDRPLPDFWIKNLAFTAQSPMGDVAVTVNDITHQQDVINKATTLKASGHNMPTIKSLELSGVMDHRHNKGTDKFDLTIQDWKLSGLKLGLAGLELRSSIFDVKANAVFNGNKMNASGHGDFSRANFISKDRTVLAKEMVLALSNINTFTVDGKANGKLTHPSVSVRSDLDKKLESAFSKRIKQKQDELAKKLKEKLAQKLMSYAGDYEDDLKKINASEGGLGSITKSMSKMGKSELTDYESQVKADAKAKADKKKKAAKAKADKKKKAALKKAKDKLKKLF